MAFHLLSPGSRPLFSQAILQSAAATNPWAMVTQKEAKLRARRLAETLKCPHSEVGRKNRARISPRERMFACCFVCGGERNYNTTEHKICFCCSNGTELKRSRKHATNDDDAKVCSCVPSTYITVHSVRSVKPKKVYLQMFRCSSESNQHISKPQSRMEKVFPPGIV